MAAITTEIGAMGEKAAVKWLRRKGYMIRDLNWRNGRYELDIIAEKLYVTHFIEVKTRRVDGLTTPEDAITEEKFAALTKAARSYVAQYHIKTECQFDLIAVDVEQSGEMNIRLIEKAMEFRW
ncbi:MAG: YraN family protein [Rikenellaceae bacterium]